MVWGRAAPTTAVTAKVLVGDGIDLLLGGRDKIQVQGKDSAGAEKRNKNAVRVGNTPGKLGGVLREGEVNPTADGRGQQRSSRLRMTGGATEGQGENRAECAALKEVDHQTHGDRRGAGCLHA